MARRLKTEAPKIPIIVGGPFATLNADRILEDCPDIDCVGVGEGEELLPDYLDHLDDPGSVAGLVWRPPGEVVENAPRPLLRDLDRFPYPDRTSLPIDYIESLPLDVPAVLSLDKFCTVQTSRGCPYSCIYCDIPSLGEGRGGAARRSMSSVNCRSSTTRATARSTSPMTISSSIASGSRRSAAASSNAS